MPVPPKIKITRQENASDLDRNLDRYRVKDYDVEDAAAMRRGKLWAYTIEVIDGADKSKVLDASFNHVGIPKQHGTYANPRRIRDKRLAYYARDIWTYHHGIGPGSLICHKGLILRVVAFELVDQEYSDIGYATGNLICQPTSSGPITRVRVDDVSRVLELTTPKCSTLGCGAWATHTLETDNCDPLQDLLEVDGARDPVCEPCGTEYVHTNRIKRLNGVLTEGTA